MLWLKIRMWTFNLLLMVLTEEVDDKGEWCQVSILSLVSNQTAAMMTEYTRKNSQITGDHMSRPNTEGYERRTRTLLLPPYIPHFVSEGEYMIPD